jgi:phospholipase/carboxylesterase
MTCLQTIELDPGATPRATVVVLHGLGADGTDFLPLADEMKLGAVGPVRWVFPRAPVRPVTINGGYAPCAPGTTSWRPTSCGARKTRPACASRSPGARAARPRGGARRAGRRIVLAGFSQGCAITLGAGLRYPSAWPAGRPVGLPAAGGHTAAERHAANAARRCSWPTAARRHRRAAGARRARPRCAAGPGPARRVARLPDGALGVHGRGAGAQATWLLRHDHPPP